MAPDTAHYPSFSSISRPQAAAVKPYISTKLFASADEDVPEKKLTIETITDENSSVLLYPSADPSRPVLLDAFAPWCGPCKLLDKVLKKAQPNYLDRVDFCRWNVNDKESTVELKQLFLDSGFTITKLPSLIVFREGKPVAVRPGFANEFQLDDWLEKTLPDVLERTFDEHGVKMVPLPENMMIPKKEEVSTDVKVAKKEEPAASAAELPLPEKTMVENEKKKAAEPKKLEAVTQVVIEGQKDKGEDDDCNDPEECWKRLEKTVWQNRTVTPAMDGILLPSRTSSVSP